MTQDAIIEAPIITPQEQLFIDEYCVSLNKALAFRKAYPERTGENASARAAEIIDKPHIYEKIADKLQRYLDTEIARAPNVLLKYIERFMELDPSVYYNDDGTCKPMSELSTEARLLISNVDKQVNNRTGNIVMTYVLPEKSKLLDKLSELVRFVAQVRAMLGDRGDAINEAARKRDAILNKYRKTGTKNTNPEGEASAV